MINGLNFTTKWNVYTAQQLPGNGSPFTNWISQNKNAVSNDGSVPSVSLYVARADQPPLEQDSQNHDLGVSC